MISRLFVVLPLFTLSLGGLPLSRSISRNVLDEEYEIYPIPHNISYKNDVLNIEDDVYLSYSNNIDSYTVSRCFDVLSLKDVRAFKSTTKISGSYTTVSLKTKDDVTLSDELSYFNTKIDAYYLDITSNKIEIIGKDTDAAFYALASLEFIFKQTGSSRTIRQLTIKDYADLAYRGFIEGFYGDPWSAEDREDLMRSGSKTKNNIYIYAPKDDKYHSAAWRELYDAKNLARLKEQIDVGKKTKNQLVYALHPFINDPLKESTFNKDIQDVINKLEQIYSAGCRQFMISGDDAIIPGTTEENYKQLNLEYAQMQNKALNIVAKWCKDKGDCKSLLFVPGAYCYSAEIALYVFNCEYYFRGLIFGTDGDVPNCSTYLDRSVEIMWTGNVICSRLSDGKLDEFIEFCDGRKPFIWMNYPVNDYSPELLRMGPGEAFDVLFDDTDSAKISGLVSNLMTEVEPNKLSIFSTGDYCWNTRDFNCSKSYRDSFKYIEENTPDALFEICQHLRNTIAKFSDSHFEEAPELASLIAEFNLEYPTGNYSSSLNKLIVYFNKLNDACEEFIAHGANRKLVETMKAWVESIRYGSLSALNYLKVLSNEYSRSEAMYYKKQANNLFELFKHQSIKSPNSATYNIKYVDVTPGLIVLQPFLSKLDELSNDVASTTGIKISLEKYPYSDALSEDTPGLVYQGVDGKMDYMVDGDLSTRAYFMFNDWLYGFQFDLIFDYGTSMNISSFDLYQGVDSRLWCWIEYSNDGVNYQRIPYISEANKEISFMTDEINYGLLDGEMTDSGYYRAIQNSHIELKTPINARYIKLKNYSTNCRVEIFELMLNGAPIGHKDIITFKGLTLSDGQDINNLINNQPVEFEPFASEEMVLDYDLGEQKHISNIEFEMDSNYSLENYQLLISKDGYNYYKYNNKEEVDARFIRVYSNSPTNKKLIINKLEASYYE